MISCVISCQELSRCAALWLVLFFGESRAVNFKIYKFKALDDFGVLSDF